ncbi:TRAP transporter permease [Desmospora profundinema]|uniref:TRAP transporter 4TM/12TM fusion protein n=1 Tax=Desmospora profundinema TaxID=1571184 RepID=A0ABU1IHY1_9BACL|nr:TRAP transporter permease [Desmospora profundinema]MDR6224382.1 TRAP transporter 4TM/12TM fusion protein [Desmospora profundinema]
MKSSQPEVEQQSVLEKYDKESKYRVFDAKWAAWLVSILAVGLSLYHLYTSAFPLLNTYPHRAVHLAVMLALVFLLFPMRKKSPRNRFTWIDGSLAVMGLATGAYILFYYTDLVQRGTTLYNDVDLWLSIMTVLLVLEGARRVIGWGLPVLAILFLLYAVYGQQVPLDAFAHRGYSWEDTIAYLFMGLEGIYGTAIGVSATYIFLFILFGAILAKSGMGQFFNDLALALAGSSKGGPAKVAVLSSGFMGSINGSAVANVVSTGAFTIPLMKKIGYHRNFAGAVESSASVGGQVLPPIMGAAAFIMAETLGVSYGTIALAGLLPALLFYLSVLTQVHLRADRLGLTGIPKKEIPKVKEVLKERGHLLIPLFFLIYMLFFSSVTILYSAFWTILVTIGVASLRKTTRMGIRDLLDALETGARSTIGVAMACAVVGIIVGVAALTGFGLSLASGIIEFGGGSLFLTLVFTMLASIVLGMGVPSIPAYVITVTMAAPALIQMGVEPLVAHMFVFYFGIFANITPPVALAAFAAAGVSGGDPMRTGFQALKLAAAGFIVPYLFVYSNQLLLVDTAWSEAILVSLSAALGVLMLGTALEGYLFTRIPWMLRFSLAVCALLLIQPNGLTDLVGIGVAAVTVLWQWRQKGKERKGSSVSA